MCSVGTNKNLETKVETKMNKIRSNSCTDESIFCSLDSPLYSRYNSSISTYLYICTYHSKEFQKIKQFQQYVKKLNANHVSNSFQH